MSDSSIKKIIEALLFVSEKPLSVKQIIEVCPEFEAQQIKAVFKELKELYSDQDRGVQIREVAGGYQFSSNPDCSEYVKRLYKTRRVFRLSAPALETLAIIAYKQPVTRAEIEFIRGVNVDGVIKTLEDRELIKIKGRKEVPGRPLIYGTTEAFLHYFGLKSLQDLPSLEEFTAQNLDSAALDEENAVGLDQEMQNEQISENQIQENTDIEQDSNTEDNKSAETINELIDDGNFENSDKEIMENKEGDKYNEHKETTKSN